MKGISQKETDEIMKVLTSSIIMAKNAFGKLAFTTKLAAGKLKRLGVNINGTKKDNR